jgi:hypothetical protein
MTVGWPYWLMFAVLAAPVVFVVAVNVRDAFRAWRA